MTKAATCFDVSNLSTEQLVDWVDLEIKLGMDFANGKISPISKMPAEYPALDLVRLEEGDEGLSGPELKKQVMDKVDRAFLYRTDKPTRDSFLHCYRSLFLKYLENPGLVRNFKFFKVPESDAMLLFYINVWTGNMAGVMDLLHHNAPHFSYVNLAGEIATDFDSRDSWPQMSMHEAMNINEREKAKEVCDEINRLAKSLGRPPKVTALGSGNFPERFYGLPETKLTLFDSSPTVLPESRLFSVATPAGHFNAKNLVFYHEDLFGACSHSELIRTQDLVTLRGVSMYLEDKSVADALVVGAKLLSLSREMMVDFLVLTKSMVRVGLQGWPKKPTEMFISKNADEAILRAQYVMGIANMLLFKDGLRFSISDIKVTNLPPWGVQSVRVKYLKEPK
ncbi:hypothetical protein IJH29_00280 [Candidatus Saccharibacteria bacterium]|nr:hypothetical protein [Candidatus Saccharibacteria bacterium]